MDVRRCPILSDSVVQTEKGEKNRVEVMETTSKKPHLFCASKSENAARTARGGYWHVQRRRDGVDKDGERNASGGVLLRSVRHPVNRIHRYLDTVISGDGNDASRNRRGRVVTGQLVMRDVCLRNANLFRQSGLRPAQQAAHVFNAGCDHCQIIVPLFVQVNRGAILFV